MPGKFISRLRRLIRDTTGQDMVEYALLAGFVAVAAGATLPNMSHRLWHIFHTLEKVVDQAAEAGSSKKG
jgi:Flp pilus assembly pilin Flp